jgi:hypothetical protein
MAVRSAAARRSEAKLDASRNESQARQLATDMRSSVPMLAMNVDCIKYALHIFKAVS